MEHELGSTFKININPTDLIADKQMIWDEIFFPDSNKGHTQSSEATCVESCAQKT